MQSLTGQYECSHRSGIGMDYFTARLDRLIIQANGRFVLVVQERSRIGHAARSLLSGEQISNDTPETRREGKYSRLGNIITFHFDDGAKEQGQLTANGIQIGENIFEKVSDSTLLPPTHRLKQNMEDIAKGLKIAGAIGGAAINAAKTIQDSLQASQNTQPASSSTPPSSSGTTPQVQRNSSPASTVSPSPAQAPAAQSSQDDETLFCDQCGAPVRPGKRFCNQCGARLP